MNLKSTRRILSIAIAFVVASCLVLISICGVISQTVGSRDFYINHLVNSEVVSECNAQLDAKYNALSKKSNIPADVFNSITTAFPTEENLHRATEYLFDENDQTFNTQSIVDFFYNSCCEYLDANEVEYDEGSIMNVANEAARIYSDTVGIHGLDGVSRYVTDYRHSYISLMSVSVIVLFVFTILILSIYKEKYKALYYVAGGFIGAGIADLLISLLCTVSKVIDKHIVYPNVITDALHKMTSLYELYLAVAGMAVLVLGVALFGIAVKQYNTKKSHKDTRFFKVVTKL